MSKKKNNFMSDVYEDEEIFTIPNNQEVKKKAINHYNHKIKCKNQRQQEFLDSIDNNEITICIGDSGVGKSYLSIAKALELLKNNNNGYNKIYIIHFI